MSKMQRDELFPSGVVLPRGIKKSCIDGIFQAIKKELPQEAQRVEVITAILSDAKEKIRQMRIEL